MQCMNINLSFRDMFLITSPMRAQCSWVSERNPRVTLATPQKSSAQSRSFADQVDHPSVIYVIYWYQSRCVPLSFFVSVWYVIKHVPIPCPSVPFHRWLCLGDVIQEVHPWLGIDRNMAGQLSTHYRFLGTISLLMGLFNFKFVKAKPWRHKATLNLIKAHYRWACHAQQNCTLDPGQVHRSRRHGGNTNDSAQSSCTMCLWH